MPYHYDPKFSHFTGWNPIALGGIILFVVVLIVAGISQLI